WAVSCWPQLLEPRSRKARARKLAGIQFNSTRMPPRIDFAKASPVLLQPFTGMATFLIFHGCGAFGLLRSDSAASIPAWRKCIRFSIPHGSHAGANRNHAAG